MRIARLIALAAALAACGTKGSGVGIDAGARYGYPGGPYFPGNGGGGGGGAGTVTNVISSNGALSIANATTVPDLSVAAISGVADKAITAISAAHVGTLAYFVDSCTAGTGMSCSVTNNVLTPTVNIDRKSVV